jgi:predicted Zn-dependent protease
MKRHVGLRGAMAALTTAVIVFACAYSTNPITGKNEAYAYSWQQEIGIGRDADKGIVQQYGIYDDAAVSEYVERIGNEVLKHSHLRREGSKQVFLDTEFHFRVLDSPVVNAFALPGGYIYVTRGLLAHIENEAQLAVVLGHEIGHVAGRHSSERALGSRLGQLGLLGGAILGEAVFDIPAQELMRIGGEAMQYVFLSYGRDDEREADKLGVEYAAIAGYSTAEASLFFQSLARIQSSHGASLPEWQSTHPDPGERSVRMIQLADQWSQKGYTMNVVARDALYQAIDGIVVGDDPRLGFTDGVYFYLPAMNVQFPVPRGWHVANEPTQVQVVEPTKQASALILRTLDGGKTLAAASREFQGGQGVTVISNEARRIGPFAAYTIVADIAQQQGTARLRRTYIDVDGTTFDFVGISSPDGFAEQDTEFRKAHFGFGRLTDPDMSDLDPARIAVFETVRQSPFQALVSGELPHGVTLNALAIMNQTTLEEMIPSGRKVKLLR